MSFQKCQIYPRGWTTAHHCIFFFLFLFGNVENPSRYCASPSHPGNTTTLHLSYSKRRQQNQTMRSRRFTFSLCPFPCSVQPCSIVFRSGAVSEPSLSLSSCRETASIVHGLAVTISDMEPQSFRSLGVLFRLPEYEMMGFHDTDTTWQCSLHLVLQHSVSIIFRILCRSSLAATILEGYNEASCPL